MAKPGQKGPLRNFVIAMGAETGVTKVPMQPLRILIVEDDASVMVAIERLVRALGFDASVAPSAEAVLGTTPLDGFACMLVDINLPGKTGVDMVKLLRSRGVNIPTVFMSGSENWSYRKDIEALGAGFLLKPFTADVLLAAIQLASAFKECGPLGQPAFSGMGRVMPRQD
jgi:FixJ family two-component response regulator